MGRSSDWPFYKSEYVRPTKGQDRSSLHSKGCCPSLGIRILGAVTRKAPDVFDLMFPPTHSSLCENADGLFLGEIPGTET
jgi:hypothetical protein